MNYKVFFTSAKTGEGVAQVKEALRGKTSLFAGQSGAGKSSLLNYIFPDAAQKTGGINKKYDRGNHTTSRSVLFENDDIRIIDTPGMRQIFPSGPRKKDLIFYFRDMADLAANCRFAPSCTHTQEAGCAVLLALEQNKILHDRYKTFIKLYNTKDIWNDYGNTQN